MTKVHLTTLQCNPGWNEVKHLGLWQICTHCCSYFVLFFQADFLESCDILGYAARQNRLSDPSTDSLLDWGPKTWLYHSSTLKGFLQLSHCTGDLSGIIVMLEDPAPFHPHCSHWWKPGWRLKEARFPFCCKPVLLHVWYLLCIFNHSDSYVVNKMDTCPF